MHGAAPGAGWPSPCRGGGDKHRHRGEWNLIMAESNPRLQNIKAALDDVGAAGDAARLQIHLLSLRARERTEELATNIEAFEQRLDRGIEQAMQAAASKTRQLSGAVRDLLGQVPAQADDALLVKSIMTDVPATCSPEDTLNAAAQRMWDLDCGAVPVLEEGELSGIITDRDICMAAYTRGLPLTAIRIGEIMAKHVRACAPEDSLERAAALMADAQVRRLPVVDAERRLLGIVSLADIARSATLLGQREAAELVYQLVRALSQRPHRAITEHGQAAE
jgi:CBS domain-containing protein